MNKLTQHAAQQIRTSFQRGTSASRLARQWGVSVRHVYRVINNEAWSSSAYQKPARRSLEPHLKELVKQRLNGTTFSEIAEALHKSGITYTPERIRQVINEQMESNK